MKIDISILPELEKQGFNVKVNELQGKEVYLINPQHMGVLWTKDNLIFRSSMWDQDGNLISAGFKKFFNLTEQPNLIPDPYDIKKCSIREKIDGSCLIVSRYKDKLITRTRGTFDARTLDNGDEIDYLIKKYPKAFANIVIAYGEYSMIYEWVSPKNKIVIDYGKEPDIYLTGIINHNDYTYTSQKELEYYGGTFDVKTTPFYTFDTFPNLLKAVEAFRGKEGVCVYYNRDQDIKKVKGVQYLTLHAFKNEVNLKNLVDLFLEYDKPSYNDFLARIEANFDYECMQMAMRFVSEIADADKHVQKIIEHMWTFTDPLKYIDRKEAAEKIISAYGKTGRSGCAFSILDGMSINDKQYKNLLFQKLGGEV